MLLQKSFLIMQTHTTMQRVQETTLCARRMQHATAHDLRITCRILQDPVHFNDLGNVLRVKGARCGLWNLSHLLVHACVLHAVWRVSCGLSFTSFGYFSPSPDPHLNLPSCARVTA